MSGKDPGWFLLEDMQMSLLVSPALLSPLPSAVEYGDQPLPSYFAGRHGRGGEGKGRGESLNDMGQEEGEEGRKGRGKV